MYRCSLPPNAAVKNSKVPGEVLLRIYGPVQDETNVIVTEATTFMLLAERGLGPRLYAVFPRGRLEEFIPSRILKTEDYRQMYRVIAKELAKIHALEVPIRKVPDFWPVYMKKWIKEVENGTLRNSNQKHALLGFYEKEMEWLRSDMEKSDSPVVYCHNDLQGGNILLRHDSPKIGEPKLVLIDFEFGAYNYRGFDLANQFCEWCFDYNTGDNPFFTYDSKKFPSEQEQSAYIEAYLEQMVQEGVTQVSDMKEEVQTILKEITLFSMAAHLIWSLWSVKMSLTSSMHFAHMEHGKTRRSAYRMFKEQYLKTSLSNGDSKPISANH